MVTFQNLLKRRRIFALRNLFPYNPWKKWMFLDLLNSYSFDRIFFQQFYQKISEIITDFPNNIIENFLNICSLYIGFNFLICLILLSFEKVFSKLELIHENSNCPDVSLHIIIPIDCLGSCILQSAYKSIYLIFPWANHPRKSIVTKFNVTLIGDENIFRFQLSVDDSMTVQKLHTLNDLSN